MVTTTFVASDFGQREHIMIVLVLPYILLHALRQSGGTSQAWIVTLVGIMAGVGFALKPYFLVLYLALEVHAWRGVSSVGDRIESVIVAIVQVAYYAFLVAVHREYIEIVLTMGTLYGAYNTTFGDLVLNRVSPLWLLSTLLVVVFRSKEQWGGLRNVTYLAGTALFAS